MIDLLFDARWYLATYPEVEEKGLDPLEHYLARGDAAGFWPHPLFDPARYGAGYPELAASGGERLRHYLQHGGRDGADPHPLFRTGFYLAQCPELAGAGGNPLVHYLAEGEARGLRPNPGFDPRFYAEMNPDLAGLEGRLLVHYACHGAREGRGPGPLFDPGWYVERSPQAARWPSGPLAHWLDRGDAEGLPPHPLFDSEHYGARHPDLPAGEGARLGHYLEHGGRDGADPHPLFSSDFYLGQCPGLRDEARNPLVHYLREGEAQGLRPHPLFDPGFYARANSDLDPRTTPLLVHWVRYGGREGRRPNPLFWAAFYRDAQPESRRSRFDPLSHYVLEGDAAGSSPHPLFDPACYGAGHPELPARGGARLLHYLAHGGRDGSNPHPLFHSRFYLEQCPELSDGVEPLLVHYLREGEARGLRPNPLFDPTFYRRENSDLAGFDMPLLVHFARYGGREGRRPCVVFDARHYLLHHPRLERDGGNPLVHWFSEGAEAGDAPHPLFDATWYRNEYGEASTSGLDPLSHWLVRGAARGFDPHPLFDSAWYREHYASFLGEGEIPFLHFLERGEVKGCRPNALFDPEYTAQRYAVRRRPGEGHLAHFLREGVAQGFRPSPLFDFCVQFFRDRRAERRRRGANPLAGWFAEPCARFTCPEVELPLALPEEAAPLVSVIVPVHGQLVHTLACLRSVARAETEVPFEVIVVDDASPEAEHRELARIPNLRLLRNEVNQGFVHACNRGAREARGRELVFLNNDTLVRDLWLDRLLETRRAFPGAGLVGARLLWPNGRLQEAGGLVFSDGTAANYGHDADPEDPAYSFARKVDYVSAACVLVARQVFEELGGFDTRYAPAFYEDTDLAFRVREAGLDVVYQPAASVVHFGGASHGRDVARGLKRHQERNRETFRARWSEALRGHAPADAPRERAASRLLGRRALVMDSTLLTPDQDSGSLRMFNLIRVLRRLGLGVTFVPSDLACNERYVRLLQRNGVQVVTSPHVASVEAFLEASGSDFELCLLSRPPVAERWLDTARLLCPRATLLYDTVDLHFLRRARELRVRGRSSLPATTREEELRACRRADGALVVSEYDRQRLLQEDRELRVHVVSNIHELHPSRVPFEERRGILFIGGFRHEPNVDGVCWFVREILPRVLESIPEAKLHVVGSEAPEDVLALAGPSVSVEGWVADPREFLTRCCVSVAPLRYGSGVKGKLNQSMSFGLPCVATSLAAEGMEAKPGLEILVADGPREFADAVIQLHREADLWRTLSENGLRNVERNFSMQAAQERLGEALRFYGLP